MFRISIFIEIEKIGGCQSLGGGGNRDKLFNG